MPQNVCVFKSRLHVQNVQQFISTISRSHFQFFCFFSLSFSLFFLSLFSLPIFFALQMLHEDVVPHLACGKRNLIIEDNGAWFISSLHSIALLLYSEEWKKASLFPHFHISHARPRYGTRKKKKERRSGNRWFWIQEPENSIPFFFNRVPIRGRSCFSTSSFADWAKFSTITVQYS